jgi:Arc/MetJ-type ribon-helix-helix transcriptional regulator
MMTTTIQTTLPTRLAERMEALIREGWFPNADALIAEALRRFLDTHRAELMERFIREDVEWGLYGTD